MGKSFYYISFLVLTLAMMACKNEEPVPPTPPEPPVPTDSVVTVDTMTYSGTLPVLFINTEGGRDIVSREKEDYLQAEWWLDNMGSEAYQSIGSPAAPLTTLIK